MQPYLSVTHDLRRVLPRTEVGCIYLFPDQSLTGLPRDSDYPGARFLACPLLASDHNGLGLLHVGGESYIVSAVIILTDEQFTVRIYMNAIGLSTTQSSKSYIG